MQFMLAMVGEESGWESSPEEMEEIVEAMGRYNRSLVEAGALVDGAGLQPPSTAKTVSFSADADPVTTDGPFAETKEHLAGYWIIEVGSEDEALDWVRKVPVKDGKIEVREVMGYGKPMDLETFERLQAVATEELLKEHGK
ncbi:MAG: YciI family protein [Actinomycetota bacterium]|nr:YciI family protein [Actinomycetota bacterium]